MTTADERIATLETEVENLCRAFELHERRQEGEFKSISDTLMEIQRTLAARPPTWATLLMTGMGTIIGVLMGVVATHSLQ